MDQHPAAPAEQNANKASSPGSGSTIPKSSDGVWITSTPGGSSFEPEEDVPSGGGGEDVPARDAGEDAGASDKAI